MMRRCILPMLVAGLLGCAPEPTDPERIAVAYVDGDGLSLSELEAYFAVNLLPADEEESEEDTDEVKSRLFDTFVEERLLLAEAEHRKVPVDDRELSIYIGPVEEDPEGEAAPRSRLAAEARRRVMIQKLLEDAVRSLPPLGDDDVRTYLEQNRERLVPRRGLELRALMLDSVEHAGKIYNDIRRRRTSFAEAVVTHEKAPGQGLPMRVDWDGLSVEVREGLEGLKPGQVSKPLEVNGNIYLFQIESWLKRSEEAEQELIHRARQELEGLRRLQAYDGLLAEIKNRIPVRLERRNLPFRYVEEPDDSRG